MTLDAASIIQGLMGLAIAGLVADHFKLRDKLAAVEKNAVTWKFVEEVRGWQALNTAEFTAVRHELAQVAVGLAELKGQLHARSGGA